MAQVIARPIELHLILSATPQKGGNPMDIITNIANLTYAHVTGTASGNRYNFEFDQTLNPKKIPESVYLGAGTNTAVMGIRRVDPATPTEKAQQLVFRVTDSTNIADHLTFINKYNNTANIIPKNTPVIWFYGELKQHNNTSFSPVYLYTIMTRYDTNLDILTETQKIMILKSLLRGLDALRQNNYFLYDLKHENIGYDNNYECIFIDYDIYTLIKFKNGGAYINDYYNIGGTYSPYYAMIGQLLIRNRIIPAYTRLLGKKHSKLAVNGLVEVILTLFFNKFYTDSTATTVADITPYACLLEGGTWFNSTSQRLSLARRNQYICKPDAQTGNCVTVESSSYTDWVHNLISIDKIKKFVNFLECKSGYNVNLCNLLKEIIIDTNENKGLLHPDYDRIPSYDYILLRIKFLIPDPLTSEEKQLFDIATKSLPGKDDIDNFQKLLGANIDPNKKDSTGNTLLHYILQKDLRQLIEPLIRKRASMDITNQQNLRPIDLVDQKNAPDVKTIISGIQIGGYYHKYLKYKGKYIKYIQKTK